MLNKQVGLDLGISEITVKAHRGKVMQKMKADSLADMVRMSRAADPEKLLHPDKTGPLWAPLQSLNMLQHGGKERTGELVRDGGFLDVEGTRN